MPFLWGLGPTILEQLREQEQWDSLSDAGKSAYLTDMISSFFADAKIHRGKTVTVTYLAVRTDEGSELISVEIA